ncbi:MAG TPA: MFS transporter [Chthoniobacteraceae bacterium]|nr:MFS transporter [Chthoniobacteraceae bacterium]
MALCFISHFNRASITSAGDERIMQQFGISPEQMGVIYSAFLVVYTLFMIPGGWLIDRRGPRFALACMGLGSALFCVFTGGIGFGIVAAGSVWMALLVVRSLMGFLSVPLHPGVARAAGNWFPPEQQSLANGLVTGASIFAYAAVHPIFGSLIDRFDWPIAFVITGSITALLAVAWLMFATDRPADSPQPQFNAASIDVSERASVSAEWSAGRGRTLLLLTLSYSAVGYFQYLFFYWLHYYLESVLHMGKDDSRYLASLPSLAMAASMPIGGWLTDRAVRWRGAGLGLTIVPKIGMILSALFLMCGIVNTDRFWIVTCFTAALGVLGLCEASFWTVAINLSQQRGGTSAAIMNTGGNGIGLLAPVITPWVGAHLGWEWGLALGAIVGLLGALCWFGITPRDDFANENTDDA